MNDETIATVPSASEAEPLTGKRDHLRLLVIEQNPETVARLYHLCEEAGFILHASHTNGACDLHELLRRRQWDIILSAHRLPDYNVEEMLRLLARMNIDIPVVVVDSSIDDDSMIARMFHAGARDVLSPLEGEHLKCVVMRELADLKYRRERNSLADLEDGGETGPMSHTPPTSPHKPQVATTPSLSGLPRADEGRRTHDDTHLDNIQNGFPEFFAQAMHTLPAKRFKALFIVELDKGDVLKSKFDNSSIAEYLQSVENLLDSHITEKHILYRHGQFTFAVLTGHDQAILFGQIAESLRQAFEKHVFQADGQFIQSTASIGICVVSKGAESPTETLIHAKKACNKAHAAGGNKIIVATIQWPSLSAKPSAASDPWTARLTEALSDNHFRLAYQPVVNFHNDTSESYEVLLRLVDEDGLEIQPAEFIPKAEERGLMQEIDRWVIQTAVETLLQRRQAGFETRFFVKLSSVSVASPNFMPWLKSLLGHLKLPGNSFVIQLSETVVAERLEHMTEFMRQLSSIHCAVALDHYAGRRLSLTSIKKLPVKYLKIDGELIQSLSQGKRALSKLIELVNAARAHDIVTIATFVQDPYTLSILWRCRVDYVQGFYFQAPTQTMQYDFSSKL